ncbi:sugar-binding transcriptional regulator [Arthrobacter russicus]|uniref:DNA-binding transcriptional regulator LsrR (DeoR family) n=1 Tax=Arthrobacter russicus TaxID=172040 RepID=A0ABU1J891_9MICC|nr:sugar-binding domain-containing protein [Arthrobacter russicus]MDR6268624.1 DNA-binding transcriptional regulator LsrR (DeoR family) [Arthrobacter russicus]
MSTDAERQHLELLFDASRRYYLEQQSQVRIAQELNFSRATVSRLLAEARERGVVKFEVTHPMGGVLGIERELCEAFGLRQARVVDSSNPRSLPGQVARSAAELIQRTVRKDSVIAVSNGSALAAVVAELPEKRQRSSDVHVVQMIGALGKHNPMLDSPELCRKVAASFGGSYQTMPVPLILESAELAVAMRRESPIATALALAAHADIALVGIGATDRHGSGQIFEGWMTPEISAGLWRDGAVGHLVGHHFDISGKHVDSALCRRLISVSPDKLAQIKEVIAVAYGQKKVRAILAALRAGHLSTLITDFGTARAVLDLDRLTPDLDGSPGDQ